MTRPAPYLPQLATLRSSPFAHTSMYNKQFRPLPYNETFVRAATERVPSVCTRLVPLFVLGLVFVLLLVLRETTAADRTSCTCSCFLPLCDRRLSTFSLSTLAKQLLMDSCSSSTKSGQLEYIFKIPAGRACSAGALGDNSRQVPAHLEYHRRAQPTNAALRRSAPSCAPRSQT